MLYVEWQIVYRCLRWVAIVLLVLFAIFAILRIGASGSAANDFLVFGGDKGVTKSTQSLPNGASQTTITYPKSHVHVVVTDHGWAGKTFVVTRPPNKEFNLKKSDVGLFGTVQVTKPDPSHVVIKTNVGLDVGTLFFLTTLVGLIFATIVCSPPARNNDRLEEVWTKPIDRSLYALKAFGVNIVGILASQVMAAIFIMAAIALVERPYLTATASSWFVVAVAFIGPIAWYGMYAGATSWMKRNYAVVVGVAWPVAIGIPSFALMLVDHQNFYAWVIRFLATIDPMTYVGFSTHSGVGFAGAQNYAAQLAILLAVAIVGMAAGIFEWRRVEA